MSDAMNSIRNRVLGIAANQAAQSPGPNPMLLGLMKSFGLSPDAIQQFAESVKGAVEGKLAAIDDKMELILSIVRTVEMKQNEMESNMRVMLDKAMDEHAEQFAQMAEHPLQEPISQ